MRWRAVVEETDGFVVVGSATTGEESLTAAAALRPDLVLMDVNLPGHRRHRGRPPADRATDGPVVVLLSTYDEDHSTSPAAAPRRTSPRRRSARTGSQRPGPAAPAPTQAPSPLGAAGMRTASVARARVDEPPTASTRSTIARRSTSRRQARRDRSTSSSPRRQLDEVGGRPARATASAQQK